MNKKHTIESQLDCKATAALNQEILKDLERPDLPMAELIEKEEDDSKDEQQDSN